MKIGSALLVKRETGLRAGWLASIADDIAVLARTGTEVLIVSSGAIALGRILLSSSSRPHKLEESQAYAAVGQIELAHAYADHLGMQGLRTGQVLLTLTDTEERQRYLNVRATINTLLKYGVIPVINENNTVATNEIRYGDNDRLAARVATMMGADLLVLLSDVDGLYTVSPYQQDSHAEFVSLIEAITPEIEAMAGAAGSELSCGGMKTKLEAGKIATSAGTAMVITSGKRFYPLKAIDEGKRVSFFCANNRPINAWKIWISGQLVPVGRLVIDEGAAAALFAGKSLLAAGIISVEGQFDKGDTVAVITRERYEIARGLVNYNVTAMRKIAGYRRDALFALLGYDARSTVIHRNNMVVWSD
ncbi:MAG: glutamate 5-kinase [Candidatus Tokpelaia sp. JSC189]|nr:MAG: glutamate 5-kinase [Candidatus Tokpelaia sp. JSC189]